MIDKKREKCIQGIQPRQGRRKGIKLGFMLIPIILILEIVILNTPLGHIPWVIAYSSVHVALLIQLIILAAPFFIFSYIFEKENAKLREYFSLVDNHRVLSIDKIASTLSITYEQAQKDISKMIEKGFFGKSHIDSLTRSIALPILGVDIDAEIVEKTVICPCCGATSKVSSLGDNKCEYCGTVLN